MQRESEVKADEYPLEEVDLPQRPPRNIVPARDLPKRPSPGSGNAGTGLRRPGYHTTTLPDIFRTKAFPVNVPHLPFRHTLLLLIAAWFLVPSGLAGQQPPTQERPRGSAESSVFLEAMEAIRQHALEVHSDSVLWEKAIDGLVQELGDPYATVLSPEEVAAFEEESTGNYAGIGVQITELNERVTVTAVFRGTPAERAGLMVGDRIVGVDQERDDGAWTVEDASNRIRGEQGSSVRVLVERDGIQRSIPFDIVRDEVHIPAVTWERIFDEFDYVHLDRVARNSAAEVDSVLTALSDSRGLILDLRQNPGGYLDESLRLTDLFLERGDPLVRTRSRTPGNSGGLSEDTAYSRMTPRIPDVPIVVLVDGFSASASEIIAGALQDHDRAVVLGERTFGKGTVQSVVPLPGGRLMRLTSGEWFTPQGRSLNRPRDLEGRVIEPDSVPEYQSVGGRTLLGGGGVFPDQEVAGDTLTEAEQRFVEAAAEAEVPLMLRLQEAAFDLAQAARDSGTVPERFPADRIDGVRDALVADGLAASALTPEAREYLRFWLEDFLYQRLEREDLSIQVRSRRDPALSRALELLRSATSQADLFAQVERADGTPADASDPMP